MSIICRSTSTSGKPCSEFRKKKCGKFFHKLLTKTVRSLGLLQQAEQQTRLKCKHHEQEQKGGKQDNVSSRLTTNPTRPVILSILLANIWLLDNKLEYIKLHRASHWEIRYCCVFYFHWDLAARHHHRLGHPAEWTDHLLSRQRCYLSSKTHSAGLCQSCQF